VGIMRAKPKNLPRITLWYDNVYRYEKITYKHSLTELVNNAVEHYLDHIEKGEIDG